MEDNWKKALVTDSYGNPVRSISNLRLIFTLDENLSQIRYDTFCQDDVCFSPLFRNVNGNKVNEESAGKIQDYLERTYRLHLTQNKVFEILKRPLRNGVLTLYRILSSKRYGTDSPA